MKNKLIILLALFLGSSINGTSKPIEEVNVIDNMIKLLGEFNETVWIMEMTKARKEDNKEKIAQLIKQWENYEKKENLVKEKLNSKIDDLIEHFKEISYYKKGRPNYEKVKTKIQQFISGHEDWKKNLERFYPSKKESIEKWVSENLELKKTEEKEKQATPPGGAKI